MTFRAIRWQWPGVPRLLRGGAACLLGVACSGCGSVGADISLSMAQVRFVEVSAGAPEMDFHVNGAGAAYGVGFANFTSYLPVNPGATSISVHKAGAEQAIATAQAQLAGGQQYTAVISRHNGTYQEHVLQDQDAPAAPGQIALRVLNELASTSPAAVYVAPLDGDGNTGAPAVLNTGTGTASAYLLLPATRSYLVTATVLQGGLNLPVASLVVKAPSGAVRTVVFAGEVQAGTHNAVAFALNDADAL
jgi:hypothetical protein